MTSSPPRPSASLSSTPCRPRSKEWTTLSFWIHDPTTLGKIAAYLGTLIGGITFTGSIAAFIKLAAIKFTFDLPMKRYLNKPLTIANIAALATIIASDSQGLGSLLLLYATFSSFALGWNITNSIGKF